jgi:ABC-type dipeptide/oligopeptide/nickel transport system permease subunit
MNDDTKFIIFCTFVLGLSFGGMLDNAIQAKDYWVAIPLAMCLAIVVLRYDYIISKLEKIFTREVTKT